MFVEQYVITAANEVINVIDVSTAEIVKKFYDSEATYGYVTCMALFEGQSDLQGSQLAVGFSTGHVLVYDFNFLMQRNSGTQNVEFLHKFNLHKSTVSALAFDKTGSVLASGGFDTYVVVYDIIEGAALYKLMGHKDAVTQLEFHLFQYAKTENQEENETRVSHSKKSRQFDEMLVSASKDTSIKIWDLESQFCAQSLMEANQKVYSFVILKNMIITGAEDEKLRVYRCGIKQETSTSSYSYLKYAELIGTFDKKGSERVVEVSLSSDNEYLVVTSADGNIEVFKPSSEREIYKKLLRVAKKQAKKKRLHSEMEAADDEEQDTTTTKVNKEKLKERVVEGDFDAKFMFTSVCYLLVAGNKVRSTSLLQYKKKYLMLTSLHANDVFIYSCKPVPETGLFEVKKLFNMGHESHRGALR
jgi:U3 small nucleolar RNA-associated protein 12